MRLTQYMMGIQYTLRAKFEEYIRFTQTYDSFIGGSRQKRITLILFNRVCMSFRLVSERYRKHLILPFCGSRFNIFMTGIVKDQ